MCRRSQRIAQAACCSLSVKVTKFKMSLYTELVFIYMLLNHLLLALAILVNKASMISFKNSCALGRPIECKRITMSRFENVTISRSKRVPNSLDSSSWIRFRINGKLFRIRFSTEARASKSGIFKSGNNNKN